MHDELTDAEVETHVNMLKAGLALKTATAQGAGPAPLDIPDEGLAAVVKAGRPVGMPIGQWLKIILTVLQTIQPFLPQQKPS